MAELLNKQLGNYRLQQFIGHGGFADVYLGEHIHLDTTAALKVLRTRLDAREREQFLQEGRTVARLLHPHIVRVLDFGIEDAIPFLIMDYAPNGSLRDRYPKGSQLSAHEALPFLKQAASALHYAHSKQIIHRDVKPENMLLNANNEVMLSDFGIATIVRSTQASRPNEMVGTAAYMAPEQIRGQALPASDQYALGIVLYEWLSGEEPFRGTFTEVCSQHLHAPLPPLRAKYPAIPIQIEEVITKALAKEPQQRFTNVQALAEAFEAASQHEQQPDPQIERTVRRSHALAPTRYSEPAETDETVRRGERTPEAEANKTTPSELAPTRRADVPRATRPFLPSLSFMNIVRERKKSRRSFIIGGIALAGLAGTGGLTWYFVNRWRRSISAEQFTEPVTPLPTSTRTPQPGDGLFVYENHTGSVHALAWSPNGLYIVSAGADTTARVWNTTNGETLYTYQGHAGLLNTVLGVSWATHGRLIASCGEDQTVQVWEAATGNRIASHREHTARVLSVAWSPKADMLASGSADKTVRLWEDEGRKESAIYTRHTDTVYALAWSPDGKSIASGSADRTVQVWDINTQKLLSQFKGHVDTIYTLAWSPDGKSIASGSADGTVQIWDAQSAKPLLTYRGSGGLTTAISAISWSHDGKQIASANTDSTIQVWNVQSGELLTTYREHSGPIYTLAWIQSGEYIASGSSDRTVKIWRGR